MNGGFERITNRKTETRILILLSVVYIALLFSHVFQNLQQTASWLLAVSAVILYAIRHLLMDRRKPILHGMLYLLPVFEMVILLSLFYHKSQIANAVFIFFIADLILCYSKQYSLFFAFFGYVLHIIFSDRFIMLLSPEKYAWEFVSDFINYSLLIAAIVIAKTQIMQGEVQKKLMQELKEKSAENEQLAILMERDRIAGEMHDTVGHTLTTALVEIEASKMLISMDPEKAGEKMQIARTQMKKALDEIRNAVRMIKSDKTGINFTSSITKLVEDTQIHTNVIINSDISTVEGILNIQEKVLYGIIQEALTNAIKHGRCSEIDLYLKEESGIIVLHCADNGIGSHHVDFGFGLTAMKDRVEGLGGILSIATKPNNGFALTVKMPLAK